MSCLIGYHPWHRISGGHVLPADIFEPRRYRAVPWQPQADDPVAALAECPAQCPKAVRGIRHAVQQKHAAGWGLGWEFEAAVPIGPSVLRICCAAGTVTNQKMFSSDARAAVNFCFQFGKQPVFQLQVIFKCSCLTCHSRCELFSQSFCVPGLKRWPTAPQNQ